MVNKKTITVSEVIFFIVGLVSTMGILQISNISAFLMAEIVFIIFGLLSTKKFKISFDPYFLAYIFGLTITTFLSVVDGIGRNWMRRSIKGYISILIILFVVLVFQKSVDNNNKSIRYIEIYTKALKTSCLLNIIWSLLQLGSYQFFRFDLNRAVFVNYLHTATSGTTFRGGTISCSGFHWHPGNMAPLLVFAYLTTQKKWYKLLIVLVGILTFHATSIVGVFLCVAFDLFQGFSLKTIKLSKQALIKIVVEGIAVIIAVFSLFYFFDLAGLLRPILSNFWSKLLLQGTDNSSMVHFRYYQLFPSVFSHMNILQKLFGLGYGCSGYMYSLLVGQYTRLNTWAVESDYINNLVGTGVINFALISLWLMTIALKGRKINFNYVIFIIIIFIEGFGYNVQFDWVILLACVLSLSIIKGYDVFKSVKV